MELENKYRVFVAVPSRTRDDFFFSMISYGLMAFVPPLTPVPNNGFYTGEIVTSRKNMNDLMDAFVEFNRGLIFSSNPLERNVSKL